MKKYHFVYKTECTETGHYYFGVHSTNDLDDGYVGSGIKFLNHVNKYGKHTFTRTIVKMCETREGAFEYEKSLLTSNVLNDETCLNLIEGGRGERHEYDETFKTRISKTRMKRIQEGKIIPTKHTEEHKQRLRENNPGGKATSKAIYQISTNGEVIKQWPSSRQAGIQLQFRTWRNLSIVANKKGPQTAYGYYWRWADDTDVVDGKLINIKQLEQIRTDGAYRAGKSVKQLDTFGKVIKNWKNMSEAARELNIPISIISLAAQTGKTGGGYLWRK